MFHFINLKELALTSDYLQDYKETFDHYLLDIFHRLFEERKDTKAYQDYLKRFLQYYPDSIIEDFLWFIDTVDNISPDDLLNVVKEIESKVVYNNEKTLVKLILAYSHFKRLDMDLCISECEKILLSINFEELNYMIGCCHAIKLRYDLAIISFNQAIDSNVYVNESKAGLALCYLKKKKFRKAIRLSKQVVDVFPNNFKVQYNTAFIYYKLRRYNKALIYLDRSQKINHEEAHVIYYFKGAIFLKKGKRSKALENLEKARELGNKEAQALIRKII